MGTKRLAGYVILNLPLTAALLFCWLEFEAFSRIGEQFGWLAAMLTAFLVCCWLAWVSLHGIGWAMLGLRHAKPGAPGHPKDWAWPER